MKCLFLASKGKEIKEIASILGLSQRTVKYHRANIIRKFEVPNLMAAVALWIQYNPNNFVEQQNKILQLECNKQIPYFIFWKNTNSVYLGCNQKFAHLINRKSPQEVIGETDFTLGWGEGEPELFRYGDQEVMNGNSKVNEEEVLIRPDGSRIVMLVNKLPMLDKHGNCIGILGTSIDITERKKLEENLVTAKEKAETSNQAKSEFILNICEVLRIPLTGIIDLYSRQANKAANAEDEHSSQWVNNTCKQILEVVNAVIKTVSAEPPIDC